MLAGLPPLVRDGDQFNAMLTVRNTTAREMRVHATLQGIANLPGKDAADIVRTPIMLPAQDVVVAAGAAKELSWPVTVPARCLQHHLGGVRPKTRAAARTRRATASRSPVWSPAAVPVRVLQATLAQLDGTYTLPVAAPADALFVNSTSASGVRRGGIKRRGAAEADRRPARHAPLLRQLPVHLPRAEDLEVGRPEGRHAVGRRGQHAADVSRQRRPGQPTSRRAATTAPAAAIA